MKFVLFIMLFLINSGYSEVNIRLLEGQDYLKKGLISKIIFSSKDKEFVDKIKEVKEGISLSNNLYLYSIDFVEEKDSGFIVGATVILKDIPKEKISSIELDKKKFDINFKDIQFDPIDAGLTGKTIFFDENFTFSKLYALFMNYLERAIVILIILIMLVVYYLKKIFKMKKLKKEKALKIAYWKKFIKEAHKRSDIEHIYLKKNEWIDFFPNLDSAKTFESLKDIQYAKDWSNDQFEKVRSELEKLQKMVN